MLHDETCWFLAMDFDKANWKKDATVKTCKELDVPAALERSRSGNGGHIWIFFDQPINAAVVRKLGCFILTKTMESRYQISLDSYDRLFPNQDTLPKGGFDTQDGCIEHIAIRKMYRYITMLIYRSPY
ncbi:TOTE conflict system archaeo-eukaryotic primase domain-containing protein [Paenibacillus alkalitolerans]|uniref:TOTE conflict system archaeo-eukaryotic primase domain-containing protein n=1 Tax=Paenibacillus alkalitolerans TaxID=2799335 RepID=UPI0018F597D6|nr:hypothetical protein [Paenibacillus alkalitolerans]